MNTRRRHSCLRGFTLIELIVVIVIMSLLAGLSAIAYQGIADDLRMSSASNSVTASLDNARAMAIKKNRYVLTVFRPRLHRDASKQVVDIVVTQWVGDSANADRGDGDIWTYDRFVPIPGVQIRTIDVGVNVAGPGYALGDDDVWWVSTFLPANEVVQNNEPFGAIIGVLYSPEGRVVVRNSVSGADRIWVDFNQDGVQTINDSDVIAWPTPLPLPGMTAYFNLETPEGEPFISMTPILVVFDEQECRESFDTSLWTDEVLRNADYTTYIDANADRIQFNRYSGVPLK